MCWKVILMEVSFLITLHTHASNQNDHRSKSKRSPLEIGYVQFTLPSHHGATVHHDVTIHVPAVVSHGHNATTVGDKRQVMLAHTQGPLYVHRSHWEPGHVHNHAFIPGRVHHVLVPTHTLLVTQPVHTVLLHPVTVSPDVNLYRKHYGGFGVGVDYGGRGAGHGFHVL